MNSDEIRPRSNFRPGVLSSLSPILAVGGIPRKAVGLVRKWRFLTPEVR